MQFKDLSNLTFGYLTVIEKDNNPTNKRTHWCCRCKCGNETIVAAHQLVSGKTQSCGCKKYESKNVKHGKRHTRIYNIWSNIKARCTNPNEKAYPYYGRKGITICDEWRNDFMSFYNWSMEHGYNDELTIDRINNQKGYQPDNCRWITFLEQQRNKTNNVLINYNEKNITLSELSKITGLSYSLLYNRKKSAIKHTGTFTADDLLHKKSYKRIYTNKASSKRKYHPIYVDMFSKEGEYLKTISLNDAHELGFNKKAIYNCLAGRAKTSGGFIWKINN